MQYEIDFLKTKLNGLDKLKSFIGSRKEIYTILAKENPIAIIDYRNSIIQIDGIRYLIILKRIKRKFKIKVISDLTNIHQVLSEVTKDGCNIYDIERDEYWF